MDRANEKIRTSIWKHVRIPEFIYSECPVYRSLYVTMDSTIKHGIVTPARENLKRESQLEPPSLL